MPVLCITAATLPSMFYCITKIVKIVNQAEIYIAYIAHAVIPLHCCPSPSTPRQQLLISLQNFISAEAWQVMCMLLLPSLSPLPPSHFPSLFLTIFISIFHYMQQENPLLPLVGAAAKLFMHNAGKVGVALVKGQVWGGRLYSLMRSPNPNRAYTVCCHVLFGLAMSFTLRRVVRFDRLYSKRSRGRR